MELKGLTNLSLSLSRSLLAFVKPNDLCDLVNLNDLIWIVDTKLLKLNYSVWWNHQVAYVTKCKCSRIDATLQTCMQTIPLSVFNKMHWKQNNTWWVMIISWWSGLILKKTAWINQQQTVAITRRELSRKYRVFLLARFNDKRFRECSVHTKTYWNEIDGDNVSEELMLRDCGWRITLKMSGRGIFRLSTSVPLACHFAVIV